MWKRAAGQHASFHGGTLGFVITAGISVLLPPFSALGGTSTMRQEYCSFSVTRVISQPEQGREI